MTDANVPDHIAEGLELAIAAVRCWLDGYVGCDDEAVGMFESVAAEVMDGARVSDFAWGLCLLWFEGVVTQDGDPEVELRDIALVCARIKF